MTSPSCVCADGKPPPQTELALLSEASEFLDFSAFSGEVIAINFFASWCAPCRAGS